jgi:uncharacterized protein
MGRSRGACRFRAGGVLASVLLAVGAAPAPSPPEGRIRWEAWSDAVFERARREERLVLLDLEAVWCHWCHVMDETTYRHPAVVARIASRFIAVKVDQDARPDLSNRYEDYGWPATVIFDGSGRELVKLQGYIPPGRMASLLQAVIDDPTPGPSVTREKPVPLAAGTLTPELRQELAGLLASRYDPEHGGWGFSHKYLDADSVEHCLVLARAGDAACQRMARETIDRQIAHLVDPVWGGVYQYSDGGLWTNPHFEKIMPSQVDNLRVFAQAYALWRDPAHLRAARDVHRFLDRFLKSPQGAFYVSQDADVVRGRHSAAYFALSDADRRKRGIPRVDRHLYARETAWVVEALTVLHGVTGEDLYRDQALLAARWLLAHRALPGGGFRHDTRDAAGPYLGDTLAAGRAFLALYAATADRAWLSRAREAAAYMDRRFRRDGVPGFVTAAASASLPEPRPQREENVALARFTNLLWRYTGQEAHRGMAEEALRYLAIPEVARRYNTGGVLLAERELRSEPTHVTVVGAREDPAARALLAAALADPAAYKRVELWDRREGPLPHMDVTYPTLGRAAAFVCVEGRCSPPAYSADELRRRLPSLPNPNGRPTT